MHIQRHEGLSLRRHRQRLDGPAGSLNRLACRIAGGGIDQVDGDFGVALGGSQRLVGRATCAQQMPCAVKDSRFGPCAANIDAEEGSVCHRLMTNDGSQMHHTGAEKDEIGDWRLEN